MKIGIIGATSNIAGKAYLPVYAHLQDQHDFVMYSRDLAKAEALKSRTHFSDAVSDLTALESCEAVCIHAATAEHFHLAKYFLTRGIPVLLDKPISENFSETQELLTLGKKTLFMTAFNRRYAPQMQKLKEVPDKQVVRTVKNLAAHQGEPVFQLYDIFSHPLDTLLYLLDDLPEKLIHGENWWYNIKLVEEKLQRVDVWVETPTATGSASMNLNAGAFQEEMTVEAPSGIYRLSDLTHFVKFDGNQKIISDPNGWNSAPVNRGFDTIIMTFLDAVKSDKVLKQPYVLLTHQIISEILQKEGLT
ncbi:MAG: Gfo/Idh/MocA family oxidoreductase [Streptococcaceae bacterium]|jgi:virulence factor|nr:Gfo/Idh/MocA family oxidoreductase [Streptococcaceae bacterium]